MKGKEHIHHDYNSIDIGVTITVPRRRKQKRTGSTNSQSTGWKKLLWLKQPYDDNYTDSSFLSQLKRNSTVVKYSYVKLVNDFSIIVLHLSSIMFVVVVFYGIYQLNWNPIKPTVISTICTLIGFIFYVVTLKIIRNKELIELQQFKINQLYMVPSASTNLMKDGTDHDDTLEDYLTEPSPPDFFETCKSSVLILLYLLTLSPVLKSLTNSTSSDSIWALSAWLCILNVMFNDYEIEFYRLSPRDKLLHWKKLLHLHTPCMELKFKFEYTLELHLKLKYPIFVEISITFSDFKMSLQTEFIR